MGRQIVVLIQTWGGSEQRKDQNNYLKCFSIQGCTLNQEEKCCYEGSTHREKRQDLRLWKSQQRSKNKHQKWENRRLDSYWSNDLEATRGNQKSAGAGSDPVYLECRRTSRTNRAAAGKTASSEKIHLQESPPNSLKMYLQGGQRHLQSSLGPGRASSSLSLHPAVYVVLCSQYLLFLFFLKFFCTLPFNLSSEYWKECLRGVLTRKS